MVKRKELLEILSKESDKDLVDFILQCKQESSSCLSDALSSCSEKQLSHIWEKTYALVGDKLQGIIKETNVEDTDKLDLLHCLILMMTAMLSQTDVYMCDPMFQMAFLLKESFPAIPPAKDKMKLALAKLFENWWKKNLYGRQHLINTTFTYILHRSMELENKEVAAVVNRVWNLHEIIPLIDLHAVASQDLKDLLTKCFISPQYIRNEQGIKFLAYVLTEDTVFTKSLHETIKKHIAHKPRSWPAKYGEVYFKAWQQLYKCGGERLLEFEQNCIQDLMSVALHAQPGIAPVLRKVLGYIHEQQKKKERGVEEMLCRLYKPLLWRMLKAANHVVRKNAALLFFGVFPITDPGLGKEEAQQLLQTQFDLFAYLLNDPFPSIRSATVIGVFQVLKDYWELFTEDHLKNLIKVIINDLRFDASSKDVRESVIRGFICLLDNPLSHIFLKSVLPKLQGSFHDVSETVRVAMVDLLLKVKMVRGIKYWHIVPADHLLARLAHDDDPVNRRIVKLVFSNMIPLGQLGDHQIDRCVSLIETNQTASRQFYRLAAKQMSLEDTVEYIVTICKGILVAVNRALKREEREHSKRTDEMSDQMDISDMDVGASNKSADTSSDTPANSNEDGESDDDDDDDDDKLNVENTVIMRGMLEAIFILWTMIRAPLSKSSNADIKKYLDKRLSVSIVKMEKVFQDTEILSLLVRMMGYIPASYVPTASRTWLPKLRNLTDESTEKDFDDHVIALCEIQHASDIFELAVDWIQPSLDPKREEVPAGKPAKKHKRVQIVDPIEPKPLLGIRLLKFMLNDKVTNEIVLSNHIKDVETVKNLLENSMKRIQEYLDGGDKDEKKETFLLLAFTLYWRTLFHLHSENDRDNNCLLKILEVLSWTENHVLSSIGTDQQKTSADDRKVTENLSLAGQIVESLLECLCALFICGLGNERLCTSTMEFCAVLLVKDTQLQFLPKLLQCLYQDVDFVKYSSDDGTSHCLDNILPNVLSRLLVSISTYMKDHAGLCAAALQRAKTNMTDLVGHMYTSHTFTESFLDKVMTPLLATIMAELGYSSQQLDLEDDTDLSTLPTLSKWLLEILQKKSAAIKHFTKNLKDYCCELGAVTQLHSIHGAVHLLCVLQKGKCDKADLKELCNSLTVTVDRLTNIIISDEDSENTCNKEVLATIKKKMNECTEIFATAVS